MRQLSLFEALEGASVIGTLGSDSLTGSDADDTLFGGGAVTVPQDAADTLSGGAGDDHLYGNGGADWLLGGSGTDLLYGGISDDTLFGGSGVNDSTDGADSLFGQDGTDHLYGNGGADTLSGGNGADVLYGGYGDDTILGGDSNDGLGDGADLIIAGPGADSISGGNGDDTIYGGAGHTDTTDGTDTIEGGAGNDMIFGNAGDDILRGGAGNDTLYSGLGIDTLEGGAGNDTFTLGFSDQATGGEGLDTFILDASSLDSNTNTSEILQITDLEAGESLQITGVSASQTTRVTEDAAGNAQIVIDGQVFAELTGISSSTVQHLASDADANPTFGIPGSNSGPPDLTIYGTDGADNLTGTVNDDVFALRLGQDTVSAGTGNDSITIADWDTVSAPSAVSPGDLQLWLDASDSSTLTESSGAVSQWTDKSGNGNDATGNDNPTVNNGGLNGVGSIAFDGNDAFSVGSLTLGSNITAFVTAKLTAAEMLLEHSNNANANNGFYFYAPGALPVRILNGGQNADASTNVNWFGNDLTTANFTYDGTSIDYFRDGALEESKAGVAADNDITTVLNIGSRAASSLFSIGDFGEVIIFDSPLSTPDRHMVERYLSNKYGIELDASVTNTNDVIDGGTGTDTLTISSGTFMLNPGTLSSFNSIESFNLSGNDAAHEMTLTDDYYDTNGGVEGDLVTINASGNSTGITVNAATLTSPHAVHVQGSDGTDTIHGGAGNDTLTYATRTTAVNIDQTGANISGIENLTGSAQGDTLQGGLGNQTLTGGDGADELHGDVDVESFDVSAFEGGNQLWLDAADASTITETGGAVSQWNDKSGNVNHVVQSVGGNKPTVAASTLNGYGRLTFDGSDWLEKAGGLLDETDFSVFSVAEKTATKSWSNTIISEWYSGGNPNQNEWSLSHGSGVTDNTPAFGTEFGATYSGSTSSSGAVALGAPVILSGTHNTQQNTLFVDGDQTGQVAVAGSKNQVPARDLHIGTFGVNKAGYAIPMELSEIIVINNSLSTSDRQQIESYLAEKWGIDYAGAITDADELSGGAGDDIISGGLGNDTLNGGTDNDTITGGQDDDQLTGGSGDDIFIFKNSSGQDTITDFEGAGAASGDLIHILTNINGNAITNFAQLSPNISQNGADTEIDLDPTNPGTHVLTLTGITAGDLTTADFVFI